MTPSRASPGLGELLPRSNTLAADEWAALAADPALAARVSGHRPHLVVTRDCAHEREVIRRAIRGLLAGRWAGTALHRSLRAEEIAVLYPPQGRALDPEVRRLCDALREDGVRTVWMAPGSPERRKIHARGVKLATVGIAKGLPFRPVIVMGADLLKSEGKTPVEEDRRLLYVACTRAEDFLLVTAVGGGGLMDELIARGATVSGRRAGEASG